MLQIKVRLSLHLEYIDLFIIMKTTLKRETIQPGGGGYLVYLSDGDVPFFRVSFSPIFSRTGYQRRQKFWSRVKNFLPGHIPVQI